MSCSRKSWLPSTYDGDLRELLMVPMGSQEYCGIGSGLSGLHWGRCNGREPNLELRRELQGSSPFLRWTSVSLRSWNRGVRSRLVLRHGTPLDSRVVHGVSGHLSSCIWHLQLFLEDETRVSVCLRVVTSSSGLHSKRCPGIGTYLEWMWKPVSFEFWHNQRGFLLSFNVRPASA